MNLLVLLPIDCMQRRGESNCVPSNRYARPNRLSNRSRTACTKPMIFGAASTLQPFLNNALSSVASVCGHRYTPLTSDDGQYAAAAADLRCSECACATCVNNVCLLR